MNRLEFQTLAQERLDDAQALLREKRFSGAYYLAGYAVECAIKACIARQIRAEEWPDKAFSSKIYTHDLALLLDLAGLTKQVISGSALEVNWALVKGWKEDRRYGQSTQQEAIEIVDAISEPNDGVLPWLTQHW